jgi:hypothetical protein
MKRKKLGLLLVLIFFLSSCSSTRIGYYFADWYLETTIDDYFDLTSIQEDQVEIIVDQIHLWHRTKELSKLIILLKDFRNRVTTSVQPEDIFWVQMAFEKMKFRWVKRISKDISFLLTQLSSFQINHFEKKTREHYQVHLAENQLSSDEWKRKQITQLFEELEEWFGNFSKNQKNTLLNVYQPNQAEYQKHIEENKEFQDKFIFLLRQKLSAEQLEPKIVKWLIASVVEDGQNKDSLAKNQQGKMIRFFLTLDDVLTKKQRQHFINKIDDTIGDLQIIHQST